MHHAKGNPQNALQIALAWCMVALALGAWTLAYQFPLSLTLRIGGDSELRRRDDDAPFLRGVNGSEPADTLPDPEQPARRISWWQLLDRSGDRPYRWTSDTTTLAIPGVGGGAWQLEILAQSGRGDGTAAETVWRSGAGPPLSLSLPAGRPRRYRLLVPADAAGDLRLEMSTSPYLVPGDPRSLGFVLHEVRASALGGGPRAPAWPQLGLLAVATATIYLCARGFGAGPRTALGLGAGAALCAALALALARPALTLFTPVLALLGLWAGGVTLIGRALTARLARDDPATARFVRQVVGLALLAFSLRLGGMLHPHAIYSDSGFHANKLYVLSLGQLLQSAGLPAEAGGGQAPYPTGPYLLLAPSQLLLPPGSEPRVLLLQSGTALLDSLTIPLIALLAVRAGLGRPVALLGAACYLLPISALESFAVGELANIAGQAMAMPFVALLALGLAAGEQKPNALPTLTVALCAGLLAHSGVTLSLGALTAAAWAVGLAGQLRGRAQPIDPRRLAVVATIALGLTGLFYYSAPIYLDTLLDRARGGADQAGEAVRAGVAPLEMLRETVGGVLGLMPPRARGWALPIGLGLASLAGLALLWWRRDEQPRAAGLRASLIAWWLGMLLTQGLLLVADQGVRWSIFLYPALCLSAGVALGELWRRGRLGQAAAAVVLASIVGYGLLMWVSQIRDYYHI